MNAAQPQQKRMDFSEIRLVVSGLFVLIGLLGVYLTLNIRFAVSLSILLLFWFVDLTLKHVYLKQKNITILSDLSLSAFAFSVSYAISLAALDPLLTVLRTVPSNLMPELPILSGIATSTVISLTNAVGITGFVGVIWLFNLILSNSFTTLEFQTQAKIRRLILVLAVLLTTISVVLALLPQLVEFP